MNGIVLRQLRGPIVALACLALVAISVLPAEHVHFQVAGDDSTHGTLIHRHYESHHERGGPATTAGRMDDHEIEWIRVAFTTSQSGVQTPPLTIVLGAVPVSLPRPTEAAANRIDPVDASVHDPPWCTASGLRAPPPCFV